jgi:hypothetical protein
MITDIVTKSFHNLKLERDMNILQENYSSLDSSDESELEFFGSSPTTKFPNVLPVS